MKHNILITEVEIRSSIIDLALKIDKHYDDLNINRLSVIVLMDGAFVFASDLVRKLNISTDLIFIGAKSYGDAFTPKGDVEITICDKKKGLSIIENTHVLIVDDIYDTGNTITEVKNVISSSINTLSIKTCCFLCKNNTSVRNLDFYAQDIDKSQFVYGYGLDLFGRYRDLPDVCVYDK